MRSKKNKEEFCCTNWLSDEYPLYDPTDDYDASVQGEDDIIEVVDSAEAVEANDNKHITIVSLLVIMAFCMGVYYLVSTGVLR